MWENSPNDGRAELTHGKRLQKKKEETLSKDIGKERSANFPHPFSDLKAKTKAAVPVHNLAGTRPPFHSHLLVPVPQRGGREALKSGAFCHWRRPGPSRRGSGPLGPGTPNPGPQRHSNLATPTSRPPRASVGRRARPSCTDGAATPLPGSCWSAGSPCALWRAAEVSRSLPAEGPRRTTCSPSLGWGAASVTHPSLPTEQGAAGRGPVEE